MISFGLGMVLDSQPSTVSSLWQGFRGVSWAAVLTTGVFLYPCIGGHCEGKRGMNKQGILFGVVGLYR